MLRISAQALIQLTGFWVCSYSRVGSFSMGAYVITPIVQVIRDSSI